MYLSIFVCFVISLYEFTECSKDDDFQSEDDKSQIFDKNVASFELEDDLSHLTEASKQGLKGKDDQFSNEKLTGDVTDLFGTNVHIRQPGKYNDFSRRFVLQYPYDNVSRIQKIPSNMDYLTPVKAPPEIVLAVAKESIIRQASQPVDPVPDVLNKDILRSGNYWNAVWKEEVDNPSKVLRSGNNDKTKQGIDVVQAKVMPGSKLFRLVSVLKQFSPRLLYVINKGNNK